MTRRNTSVESSIISDADLIPVSKFSKFDAHIVVSNDDFIIYTTSRQSFVRIISQSSSYHFALDTEVSGRITDLHISEFTDSSKNFLTVGSRDSGIFAFWILWKDNDFVPPVLIKKLTNVPRNIEYSFINNRNLSVAFSCENYLKVYQIYEKNASQNRKNEKSSKSLTTSATIESFGDADQLCFLFDFPIGKFCFSHDFKHLACSFLKGSIATDNRKDYIDVFALPPTTFDSKPPNPTKPMRISQRNSILDAPITAKSVTYMKFFSTSLQSLSTQSLSEYLLIGQKTENGESIFSIYPSCNTTRPPILTYIPREFLLEKTTFLSFNSFLNIAMTPSEKREKIILTIFTHSNDSSDPYKLLTTSKVINFPKSLKVLDSLILNTIEPEKYPNKDVIDIYLYHSKGIAIAPAIVREKLKVESNTNESKASKVQKSQPLSISSVKAPETNTITLASENAANPSLEYQASSSEMALSQPLETKYHEAITNCIGSFLDHNPSANEEYARFLKDFILNSEILTIITNIATENVIQHLQKNNLISSTKTHTPISEITEDSVNTSRNGNKLSNIPESDRNSRLDRSSQPRTEYNEETDTEDKNGPNHILPALFDSLEEASRSEPNSITSPRQNSAEYINSSQSFENSNNANKFSAFSNQSVELPPLTTEGQKTAFAALKGSVVDNTSSNVHHDLRNTYLSPSHSSSTSPSPGLTSSRLQATGSSGTTLGQSHGHGFSPIWGAPITGSSRVNSINQQALTTSRDQSPNRLPSLFSPPLAATSQLAHFTNSSPQLSSPNITQHSHGTQIPISSLLHPQNQTPNSKSKSPQNHESSGETTPCRSSNASSYDKSESKSEYLVIEGPQYENLLDAEREIIKQLINKDPMMAFHKIRSVPVSGTNGILSHQPVDLGKVLSCAMFLSNTSIDLESVKAELEAIDSKSQTEQGGGTLPFLVNNNQDPIVVSEDDTMAWIRNLFGNDFLLILGYVAYLVSSTLNSVGGVHSNNSSNSDASSSLFSSGNIVATTGSAQRIKWAVSLLSVVSQLLGASTKEKSNEESNVKADKAAQDLWIGNKHLISPTLLRIKQDASSLCLTFLLRPDSKKLDTIIQTLLEIVENLLKA